LAVSYLQDFPMRERLGDEEVARERWLICIATRVEACVDQG
jgi:hypothetical protein